MAALHVIGFGAFVIASFAVGARLLLLARRTRQAAELSIGVAFLAGGGAGYLLVMLSTGVRVLSGPAAAAALLAGSACLAIGVVSLAVGVRAIFRPGDVYARRGIALLAAALAVSLLGRCLEPMRMPSAPWIFWTSSLASCAAYAWSAAESIHYAVTLRRRVRIGLAEAWIANRFALWGVSGCAAVAMHAISMFGRAQFGTAPVPPALLAAASLLGVVAAGGIWLAFFPPRRVRSRAQLS
ncbi:MAG: hypothetical protein DCC71_19080 [Proteobacteria bacterium]|nr:MAG: hypothetical protein DCC71_19080 [Pseudomonadota bacterium]